MHDSRPGRSDISYVRLLEHESGHPIVISRRSEGLSKIERRLMAHLGMALEDVVARERIDVVHGQHVMTCVPSVTAAKRRHVPVVCTVRDYWPVCYWSDLIHTTEGLALCPQCSAAMMTRCLRPHAPAFWPVAPPQVIRASVPNLRLAQ